MGKWTPDYTEDVFHSKLSTLVSGAIRRLAVERETTNSITYQNFVADLDTGDSFTATLMDILVKEVADRRLRTNATERSLLSERTVRSLRTLVNSSRTYTSRFRSHARRPIVNIPDYSAPELDMMDEEEDDFEIDVPPVEGARMPSDLHDAYAGSRVPSWAFSTLPTRRGLTSSPTPSDEWQPQPPQPPGSPSNPALPRPWQAAATAPNTLTQGSLSRQASIRRATRIRVDFNESSQRRRWPATARESSAVSPRPDAAESVTEPRDGLVWNRPLNSASRRFFPLQRPRRRGSWSSTWPDIREGPIPDTEDHEPVPTTSWNESTFLEPPSPPEWAHTHRFESEARPVFRVPRLRRGGVMPPESMISRHASPIIVAENAGGSSSSAVPTPAVVLTPPLDTVPGEASSIVLPVSPPRPPLLSFTVSSDSMGYPTPGSSENEHLT